MPPLDDANFENHIPEAVRRASARADELARAAGVVNVDAPEPEPQPEPAPEAAPEPAAAPQPEAAAPAVADWEQRFNTLQGKYNAELPTLRAQVASLERLLATMQAPPEQPARRETTTTVVAPTPEDVETYGEDLIAAARRWAKMEVHGELEQLRTQIDELRGGQQQIQDMSVQQRVQLALDADPVLAGKWRDLNSNPEFLAWLGQVDPFSGAPLQELLRNAYGAGDVQRTSHFFKTYLAEHTATQAVPSAPAAAHTPVEGAGDRPTFESMVAPGRANLAGGAPGGAPEKRVWTTKDITAFYRARTEGAYRGREAESQRLEQDLFEAISEGRIRR